MSEIMNKRNSIPEKRISISTLQERWVDWQHDTWVTPKCQRNDLADCGIDRDEKTIRAWRKGDLPGVDAWALLLNFGWPLLIALMGDVLASSYALEQEDYARRQNENKLMFKAVLSLMDRNSDRDGGGGAYRD